MNRTQMIKKIHESAVSYKEKLLGKNYLFVFDSSYIEVTFKKSCFLHLTGVNTRLSAANFFTHSLSEQGLRPNEIFFDEQHPFDLAEKKISLLPFLHLITSSDIVVLSNVLTLTHLYDFGLFNYNMTICLGRDIDENNRLRSSYYIPYSFRAETCPEHDNASHVDYIFEKRSIEKKYSTIKFGNFDKICDLPTNIISKLDLENT